MLQIRGLEGGREEEENSISTQATLLLFGAAKGRKELDSLAEGTREKKYSNLLPPTVFSWEFHD